MAKSKRKFRYVSVDPRSGRFVKAGKRGAKRKRIAITPVKTVFRDKKTGKFASPTAKKGRKNVVLERVGAGRARTTTQVNKLFQRKIVQKTYTQKVLEVVYEIPFQLDYLKVDKKRKRIFLPDFASIQAVFDYESVEQQHSGKTFHTAVCKVNVQFSDKETDWIQIPVGRRIPVDEPVGANDLYTELLKFLVQYAIIGVSVIQLSILRLPL